MKKNILAIAIASAVAAPVAFADAPTVYGQFNVAIDSVSDAGEAMDVVNRNSRIGVKGAADLGNGMKAVYQLETTVNVPDGGSKGSFGGARNTYVGVAGGFGTVVLGRHDTPLRMIQPSDGFADSKWAGNNTSRFNGGLAGEHRLDEVVAYLSPNFNGFAFAVAGSGQGGLEDAGDDQTLTNGTSFSVSYGSKKSGIYLAAAQTSALGGDLTVTRATAQYNEGGLVASFMYNDQKDNGTSMTAGVAYKMGAFTPRAKVSMVSYDATGADDSTNMAAGVDYALGKKTRVYAEFASLDAENASTNDDTTAISVGLFHKF